MRAARGFTVRFGLILAAGGFALALGMPVVAWAQCPANGQEDPSILALFQEQKWSDVVKAAESLPSRSADVNFQLGMSLAHLQQWQAARDALIAGRRECPEQKRFPIELAGIAIERKRYPEAAAWIGKGIKLDESGEYANNFAGTVYLLMGNVDAALKYWNRVHKPYVAAFHLDPQLRVQRLLLERAVVFSPAAILERTDLFSTDTRLQGLGIFSTYNVVLNAGSDGSFDADFNAIERNGFGDGRLQALISIFSGAAYETIYPSYFNIGGGATNVDSLLRWDAQKRRAWVSVSSPIRGLPQWRWQLTGDGRDENWEIRQSFAGTAPPLGSFHLQSETAAALVLAFHSGRLQGASGAELSHSAYSDVVYGSALTPGLVAPGFELKHLASIDATLLDIPERRISLKGSASSEFARLWSSPPDLFEKLQGSATARWLPQAEGDNYEVEQRLRAGHVFGSAPVGELFMLGVERDNDLWLRGHIGTRDGRKGSSPLADSYVLSNSDFLRRLYENGLFAIKAGPLLDIAKASAPTSVLAPRQWLFDAGMEVKLTVLGTSVVLTYGRDLRSGNNAFYGSVAQR